MSHFQPQSDVLKTKVAPESDEYVLDQLCVCEEKLMKLIEDLDGMGKNVNEVSQMMDEEEVNNHFKLIYLVSCSSKHLTVQ